MSNGFLRNCWYVAGWDRDFLSEQPVARTILNQPLVVYRSKAGALVAMDDRCPHRAAPLSLGRVEADGGLRCMYHGAKFSSTGHCVEVPGQPRIPSDFVARTFPVQERRRWVWVWMGDPAKADPALIPDVTALDAPGYVPMDGQLSYDAPYMLLNDNLLDFSHFSFVHTKSFGTSGDWARDRATIKKIDRGVYFERWLTNQPPFPFLPVNGIDLWNQYSYLVPGVLIMETHFFPAGFAERFGKAKPPSLDDALIRSVTGQAVTPATADTTIYYFTNGMDERHSAPEQMKANEAVVLQAFHEDKTIIEAQHRTMRKGPPIKLRATANDTGLSHFRIVMDQLIAAEQTGALRADVPATA